MTFRIYFGSRTAGLAEIVGVVEATEASDSAAVSGLTGISGTLAANDVADSADIAGNISLLISGSLSASEAADSVVIAGDVTPLISGTLAASEAADTATVAGAVRTVLNPNDKHVRITLTNGNLTATKNLGGASYAAVRSTDSYATGKLYFEARLDAINVVTGPSIVGLITPTGRLDDYLGHGTGADWSAGFGCDGKVYQDAGGGGSGIDTGKPIAVGEWAALAVDFDAGKAWVRDSTGWHGDPEAGTGNAISFTPNLRLHAATQLFSVSAPGPDQTTANFGASVFAYAVPFGFARWTPLLSSSGTLAASEAADTAAINGEVAGVVGTLAASEAADTASIAGEVTGEVVRPPMGGVSRLPSPWPRPVVGYGYGILPELEGEADGVVGVIGNGAGAFPGLTGAADGSAGVAGLGAARLAIKVAAVGDHGHVGAGAAVVKSPAFSSVVAFGAQGSGSGVIHFDLKGRAIGRHDDDERAVVAWLLAA